jgi:enoyl-CoA hydratase/carnithine racemase
MAPPRWVHRLATNHLGQRQGTLALTRGTLFKPSDCLRIGYVDRLVSEENALKAAEDEILAINKLPPKAWLDAKLKSVENVVQEINPKGLEGVVESISGQEFQKIVKGILASLKNKKK